MLTWMCAKHGFKIPNEDTYFKKLGFHCLTCVHAATLQREKWISKSRKVLYFYQEYAILNVVKALSPRKKPVDNKQIVNRLYVKILICTFLHQFLWRDTYDFRLPSNLYLIQVKCGMSQFVFWFCQHLLSYRN